MLARLTLILLPIWLQLAHADPGCSTIDLTKGAGPIYWQSSTSWCHAFTTTDALTRHLQKIGTLKPTERLHPLQVAAALPLDANSSVVKSTAATSTMRDDMAALANGSKLTTPDKPLHFTNGLCKESDLVDQEDRARALFNWDWNTALHAFRNQDCEPDVKHCDYRTSASSLRPLCSQLTKQEMQFWADIFNKRCKLAWPHWYVSTYYFPKRYARMDQGQTLEPKSLPGDEEAKHYLDVALESAEFAAIGYDASFMDAHADGPESHWSSVVKRFKDAKGKCNYVIRNSWGPVCKDQKNNDIYKNTVSCDGGYLTVTEDQLLPRIHSVHYFDDGTLPAAKSRPMPEGSPSAIPIAIPLDDGRGGSNI